ncbi:hypothetical protein BD410DRAFT_888845 [Rickenella mellea]|uniref:Uncharacterized protein n=1 Tax=Rickenella mellea TaxID=50990 RepID=A0A4Y7PN16_9AGAM|nr:hypothetical protein BD410DRAFT_888845 [Rickenella mellea]
MRFLRMRLLWERSYFTGCLLSPLASVCQRLQNPLAYQIPNLSLNMNLHRIHPKIINYHFRSLTSFSPSSVSYITHDNLQTFITTSRRISKPQPPPKSPKIWGSMLLYLAQTEAEGGGSREGACVRATMVPKESGYGDAIAAVQVWDGRWRRSEGCSTTV